jgi:hypothetical protein
MGLGLLEDYIGLGIGNRYVAETYIIFSICKKSMEFSAHKSSVPLQNLADTRREPWLSLFLQLLNAEFWDKYEAQFTRTLLKIWINVVGGKCNSGYSVSATFWSRTDVPRIPWLFAYAKRWSSLKVASWRLATVRTSSIKRMIHWLQNITKASVEVGSSYWGLWPRYIGKSSYKQKPQSQIANSSEF